MGVGVVELKTGEVPAAGINASITVPAGERWLVYGCSVRLATSATVASRRPSLGIIKSGVTFCHALCGATQAAGVADGDFFYRKVGATMTTVIDGNLAVNGPFPIVVDGGAIIMTLCSSLQTDDQFSALRAWVEEL